MLIVLVDLLCCLRIQVFLLYCDVCSFCFISGLYFSFLVLIGRQLFSCVVCFVFRVYRHFLKFKKDVFFSYIEHVDTHRNVSQKDRTGAAVSGRNFCCTPTRLPSRRMPLHIPEVISDNYRDW